MFAHAHAAQAVYHARLRMELSDRIGAAWEVPPAAWATWSGSTRRCAGCSRSDRRPWTNTWPGGSVPTGGIPVEGPGRSKVAFHATRPDKDRHRTVESLMVEWRSGPPTSGSTSAT